MSIAAIPASPASCSARRTSRFLTAVAAPVAVLAFVVGCSEATDSRPVATPGSGTIAPLAALEQDGNGPSILTLPPGFVVADTRAEQLPVSPTTQGVRPPIPVFGGKANITGSVLGPDGPVEGATVRIERFVGGRGGFAEVTTNKDGNYSAFNVYGGHFRIRAWLAPDLTTFEPQTTFVPAEVDRTIELRVLKRDANLLQAALNRGDPHVGEFVILEALLVNEEIDEDEGIVKGEGIKDVEVAVVPKENLQWDILERTVITDDDGYARFTLVCQEVGIWPMVVSTPEISIDVVMPECLPLEPGSSTSSTPDTVDPENPDDPDNPDNPEDTTTTTRPDQAVFPIGGRFEVPFAGPVPAGTYRSTDATCATSYELFANDRWFAGQVTGQVISSPFPMRNFRAIQNLPGCRFTRTR